MESVRSHWRQSVISSWSLWWPTAPRVLEQGSARVCHYGPFHIFSSPAGRSQAGTEPDGSWVERLKLSPSSSADGPRCLHLRARPRSGSGRLRRLGPFTESAGWRIIPAASPSPFVSPRFCSVVQPVAEIIPTCSKKCGKMVNSDVCAKTGTESMISVVH